MIRYLYAADLDTQPSLAAGMFTDRTAQFRDRLGWNVEVDDLGWETDTYDRANPLYVIVQNADGGHAGSLRFLPTTGPTMIEDHFGHLTDGVAIRSPFIWECTRFCIAPNAPRKTAAQLLAAAADLGHHMGLSHSIGVFDHRMPRVYQKLGWAPDVLGTKGGISAGIWAFEPERRADLRARADLSQKELRAAFEATFDAMPQMVR